MNNYIPVIPIRKGSQGLLNKNTKLLAGKKLYKYSMDQAIRIFGKCVISTDIEEVLETSFTPECFILKRDKKLCLNNTIMEEVIHNIITEMNLEDEVIVLLQATSPLRNDKDIENAIDLYEDNFDLVLSVCETNSNILKSGLMLKGDKFNACYDGKYLFKNRQYLPKVYRPNGAIYIIKAKDFISFDGFNCENIGGYLMPKERSYDIDKLEDFDLIERILLKNKSNY